MSSMSFQEKSAWGTLVALLAIGGLYFRTTIGLWQAGELHLHSTFGLAVGLTVLLVVVLVACHVLIAIFGGAEDDDERDRLIAWRAGNSGGLVLGFAVVSVVLMVIGSGLIGAAFWQQPAVIVNGLMTGVFIATVVELVLTIWFHRRGI